MADKEYLRDITGRAVKTDDPGHAASLVEAGATPISKPQAEKEAADTAAQDYVDQNWGVAGKLGMGLFSGLTLGVGPGLGDGIDPAHLSAAQKSGWYTAGDVAGTVAPALLSGGASLEGRGALSALARMTPAGLLEAAGTGTERLVGRALGEAGVLGSLGTPVAKMAARGAVESAAVNLGHTIGDNLIQNKPLAAESMLASAADGALFGGLIGGGLGTVGLLGSKAVEAVGEFAGSRAAGKASDAKWFKRLGGTPEGLEKGIEEFGSAENFAKESQRVLEKGGTRIGASDENLGEGLKRANWSFRADREDVVKQLSKEAASDAPYIDRIKGQLDSVVLAPRLGTGAEDDVRRIVDMAKSKLDNITPMQELKPAAVPDMVVKHTGERVPLKEWQEKAVKGAKPSTVEPAYEIPGGTFPSSERPAWDKLIKTRDQFEKLLGKEGVNTPLKREILNVIDGEINSAMESAAQKPGLEGISERYRAATVGGKVAESMQEMFGARAAAKMVNPTPILSPEEIAYAGLMAANGNPLAAVGFAGVKAGFKELKNRLEPALAQMSMDASVGAGAAKATYETKAKIAQSVKSFFKSTTDTPRKAAHVANAEKRPSKGVDRKQYEDMAHRVDTLLSAQHQERVKRYADSLAGMGYGELAGALVAANSRAVQYLTFNQPKGEGRKAAGSLRKPAVPKTLTLEQLKYFRQVKGVTMGPHAVLEGLEDGTLSRDTMAAFAYTYPEIHSEIVYQTAVNIAEKKAAGEYLPMSKITMLGIVLGNAVDSTQSPEFINAVQVALNAPPADQPPPPQPAAPGPQGFSPMAEGLMTPSQKAMTV